MSDEDEDRQRFRELLEELRVVIPGTEVLFAFLLTAPFSQRFAELQSDEQRIYALALLATAIASVLLIAPTVLHRFEKRKRRVQRLRMSVALSMAGVLALGVGVVAAVHVVISFVWGDEAGNWAAVGLAGTIILLWYLIPIGRRLVDAGRAAP